MNFFSILVLSLIFISSFAQSTTTTTGTIDTSCSATISQSVTQRWNDGALRALSNITITNTGTCPIVYLNILFMIQRLEIERQLFNLQWEASEFEPLRRVIGFGDKIDVGQSYTKAAYVLEYDPSEDGVAVIDIRDLRCSCPQASTTGASQSTTGSPTTTTTGLSSVCEDNINLYNDPQRRVDDQGNHYFFNVGTISNFGPDVRELILTITPKSGGQLPYDLTQLERIGRTNRYKLTSRTPGIAITERTSITYTFSSREKVTVRLFDCSYVLPPTTSTTTTGGHEFCSSIDISASLIAEWDEQSHHKRQWNYNVRNTGSKVITSITLKTSLQAAASIEQSWSVTKTDDKFGFPSWLQSLQVNGNWQFGFISNLLLSAKLDFTVVAMTCAK